MSFSDALASLWALLFGVIPGLIGFVLIAGIIGIGVFIAARVMRERHQGKPQGPAMRGSR